MSALSLILYPYNKQKISIELQERKSLDMTSSQFEDGLSGESVFSDLSYEFSLNHDETMEIESVHVYINDILEPSIYNEGKICFPDKKKHGKRVFLDCYGFVQISLEIIDNNGNVHTFTTPYLSVLVKHGRLNDNIKAMIGYVYNNQENLLFNGNFGSKNFGNMKSGGQQNFLSQILLANEIADLYEKNYRYFKVNSRFKIDKVSRIERFERVQYITSDTIRYIATHPEELRIASGKDGIRIYDKVYQPERIVSEVNERSYDIYENRVVLNFINEMINSIETLQNKCQDLILKIPIEGDYNEEYVYSSYFMFQETRGMLENKLADLKKIKSRFNKLLLMYREIFRIVPEPLKHVPRPSAIFISVPQYNRVFNYIYKWFQFGIYDFAREKYMLSLIKISSLYEVYILVKMISYFKDNGFKLINETRCNYPTKSKWLYKNTSCNNTFIFEKVRKRVSLYYQPVIYDYDSRDINGIGLFRNNSLSVLDREDYKSSSGNYYSPDYLLKIEKENSTQYLILDAKFSNLSNVKKYQVKNLVFKYLFSISPLNCEDNILGLCLIYGKFEENEELKSVYDKKVVDRMITPVVDLMPLMEDIDNDKHYKKLDMLFEKTVLHEQTS